MSHGGAFGLKAPLPARNLAPEDAPGEAPAPVWTAQFAACWMKAWENGGRDSLGWQWNPYLGQSNGHGPIHGHHGHAHASGHDGFGGHHGGFAGGHGAGGGHF